MVRKANLKDLVFSMGDDEPEPQEIATPMKDPAKKRAPKVAYSSPQKPKITKAREIEPDDDNYEDEEEEYSEPIIRKKTLVESALEKYSRLEELLNGEKQLSAKRETELREEIKRLESKLESSTKGLKESYNESLNKVKLGLIRY